MKIELRIQQYHRQTDTHTDTQSGFLSSLSELIKECNYNLHDGRIGGCGAWDARRCGMWSMPEGRQGEPRELAKGPESAIGQVRHYRGKFWQMVPDNISCVKRGVWREGGQNNSN